VLGSLITTLDLTADEPQTDQCGRCTACLDACPTGALVAPGVVDARLCITAWTVESPLPELPAHAPPLHGWAFGCDECQEICPYQARGVLNPALPGKPGLAFIRSADLEEKSASDRLDCEIAGTPLARAKVKGLMRNAKAQRDS